MTMGQISLRLCIVACACVGGEDKTPSITYPHSSISLSLRIVVPSIGNFSKFCYGLIFIRFKGFLGIGELPNRPTPFMDVCANTFFQPDLEGGWGH
jgi:hypothetical protein